MMDQIAAIQRLKRIWAARRGKWMAALMIDFVLNVLAVTLALALLAMIAWPIDRMLPCTSSIAGRYHCAAGSGDRFRLHKRLHKCLLGG
jgi:hypothetical protein